jgi:hypothetical protein
MTACHASSWHPHGLVPYYEGHEHRFDWLGPGPDRRLCTPEFEEREEHGINSAGSCEGHTVAPAWQWLLSCASYCATKHLY